MKQLLFLLLSLLAPALQSQGLDETNDFKHLLTEVTDFSADGAKSRLGKRAILLLVSQDHCPFCDQIKRDILGPMVVSGEYDDRLLFREIYIDLGSRVLDFKGVEKESSSFMLEYKVYLTPTLLFLDADGHELTERMIGIQTPEMFLFYVDRAVQEAIAVYRKRG